MIQANAISIFLIKVYKAEMNTLDSYLSNPMKPDNIETKIGQDISLNVTKKNVRIRLNIQFDAMDSEKNPLGLSGVYGIEFHIHVDDLEAYLVYENERALIDRELALVLSGLAFSTARGIIFERTASTYFNGVLLPVIAPSHLLDLSLCS